MFCGTSGFACTRKNRSLISLRSVPIFAKIGTDFYARCFCKKNRYRFRPISQKIGTDFIAIFTENRCRRKIGTDYRYRCYSDLQRFCTFPRFSWELLSEITKSVPISVPISVETGTDFHRNRYRFDRFQRLLGLLGVGLGILGIA